MEEDLFTLILHALDHAINDSILLRHDVGEGTRHLLRNRVLLEEDLFTLILHALDHAINDSIPLRRGLGEGTRDLLRNRVLLRRDLGEGAAHLLGQGLRIGRAHTRSHCVAYRLGPRLFSVHTVKVTHTQSHSRAAGRVEGYARRPDATDLWRRMLITQLYQHQRYQRESSAQHAFRALAILCPCCLFARRTHLPSLLGHGQDHVDSLLGHLGGNG